MAGQDLTLRAGVLLAGTAIALLLGGCGADVSKAPGGGSPDAGEVDGYHGLNTPPGQPQIALLPADPRTGDDLRVSITTEALDPDDGPEPLTYLYDWLLDDQPTQYSSDTIPSAVTARGQTWKVVVRATDGQDEGMGISAETVIGNSPPTVVGASLGPVNAGPSSVLICSAGDRRDPDGDAVSLEYAWTLDGEAIFGAKTGAIQPPLEQGAAYRCLVTPFDGELRGDPVESNAVTPEPLPTELKPMIAVQPKSLDLGTVLPDDISTGTFEVLSFGDGPLSITSWEVEGDADFFTVDFPDSVTLDPADPAKPEDLPKVGGKVTFATSEPGLKKATLVFESNAANGVAGKLPLLGLGAAPCIDPDPNEVDFGGVYLNAFKKIPVTLTSCGALPLTIDDMNLLGPDGTPFELDMGPGPGPLPWTLAPGESVFVNVTFNPSTPSPVDEDGIPIVEEAELAIHSNSVSKVLMLQVSGFSSEKSCPVPIIDLVEGDVVIPGKVLHLTASKSFSPKGSPDVFSWGASAPPGAPPVELLPSNEDVDVTFATSVPGSYEFLLNVWDDVDGQIISGCSTAKKIILAKDAIPLIFELTWDTPGDSNQNDTGPGVGADLDIHLHEGGGTAADYDGDGQPDTWFDQRHDLYWFDSSPDWGEPGPMNDPELTREDPDGKGPERIEFDRPPEGVVYTLGVHCWSDYGYGASIAKVRIYYFEDLLIEIGDVVLKSGDLWEVGTISWPKAVFSQSYSPSGGPKVIPDYPNPYFE